ncbi:MAG: hypothetical protein JSV82_08305 [Planctomycetota bacterium]|nr:MAG: hypothetical protein JSV82_08305 [Planctomycetota bacterium]
MDHFLAQVIVAARDNGMERWTNILFVVVVGIFWLVGGILKARANKAAQKGEKREPHEPARKPPDRERLLEKQVLKQARRPVGPAQRRKMVRPQPIRRKVTAEMEQAIELPTLEPMEVSKVAAPMPKLAPELGELPEFTTDEAVEKLGERRAAMAEEIPQAKYLPELLIDYDDPEKLRRAILHYEILGKPLSMRRPSEHMI